MNGDPKANLKNNILRRQASLSEAEAFFLHNLLVDDEEEPDANGTKKLARACKKLNDEILFSIPPLPKKSELKAHVGKPRRPSILGLWKAHQEGVAPKALAQRGQLDLMPSFRERELSEASSEVDDYDDIASDVEVRHGDGSSVTSEGSSWDEEDHYEHFDTWEVLRDEYSEDFGFGYSSREQITVDDVLDEDRLENNHFQILGTSADDPSCQPHVLSPPLMDALMNFLPEQLDGENFWLKFSLVRDGASLETLKRYVRAATCTLLAIETRKGEVFGAFTSSPWRNHFGYYGTAPAFVWKMRHSRQTKCYSLFDQAQLETEIDVFPYIGRSEFIQVCRHDVLAVGGDSSSMPSLRESSGDLSDRFDEGENTGFAIALEDDLCVGTTSLTKTFHNPALCGPGDKPQFFDVAGLEVWGFTPCTDVKSAEKLEMTKFFIEESTREGCSSSESSARSNSPKPYSFGSQDILQERFYQRVGEDHEAEERRQRWSYMNMMNSTTEGSAKGLGVTPRFGYS